MSRYEETKRLKEKVSQAIFDISQLSDALTDDDQYEQDWKPRLKRLLNFVTDHFGAEQEKINQKDASHDN